VPFAALLVRLLKSEHPAVLGIAAPITRRFSTTSLLAVTALAVTGSLNSVFLIGEIQAVFTTPYGRLLLAKLVLFAAMVCIGAWNLLVLKPKFATEVQPENVANQNLVARFLLRNVLCEIGLGTAVFLIVGILGISSPPMH
jgi:putative copper resistance protein D